MQFGVVGKSIEPVQRLQLLLAEAWRIAETLGRVYVLPLVDRGQVVLVVAENRNQEIRRLSDANLAAPVRSHGLQQQGEQFGALLPQLVENRGRTHKQ